MTERIHRDSAGEIEIALAVRGNQLRTLAALEAEVDPGEDGKQMRRCALGHGDH